MSVSKDKCAPFRTKKNVSNVKIKEGGRSVVFSNPSRKTFEITKVDGGLVKNQKAADYVVTIADVGDLIVELKGKEVGVACEQIIATYSIMRQCESRRGPMAGLVVCTRFPRSDTKAQRLQAAFLRDHGARLKVLENQAKCCFEDFFPA